MPESGVAEGVGDGTEDEMRCGGDGESAAVADEIGLGVIANAVPVVAGIGGGAIGGPFDGADEGEGCAISDGQFFGGFDDVGGLHGGFDAAKDVAIGEVGADEGGVNVSSGPDGAA